MTWESLEAKDSRVICTGPVYRCRQQLSFAQLVSKYDELCAELYDHRLLFTVADSCQMFYTSGHSMMNFGIDKDALSEHGRNEEYGFDVCPAKMRENFLKKAVSSSFESACKKGTGIDSDAFEILDRYTSDPNTCVDESSYIFAVPAEAQDPWAIVLYGLPNGYFSVDLNPFENYALALRLEARYHCRLVGMGASVLVFRRLKALSEEQQDALVADLDRLYGGVEQQDDLKILKGHVQNSPFLFVKYTECLEE